MLARLHWSNVHVGKFSVLWQWSNTSAGSKPNWWRKLARSASCFKLFSFFSISNQHSIWGGCSLSASCQSRGNIVFLQKVISLEDKDYFWMSDIPWGFLSHKYFLFLFIEAKLYPSHPWHWKVNSFWNSLSSLTFPWSFIFGSLCFWEGWWLWCITLRMKEWNSEDLSVLFQTKLGSPSEVWWGPSI